MVINIHVFMAYRFVSRTEKEKEWEEERGKLCELLLHHILNGSLPFLLLLSLSLSSLISMQSCLDSFSVFIIFLHQNFVHNFFRLYIYFFYPFSIYLTRYLFKLFCHSSCWSLLIPSHRSSSIHE